MAQSARVKTAGSTSVASPVAVGERASSRSGPALISRQALIAAALVMLVLGGLIIAAMPEAENSAKGAPRAEPARGASPQANTLSAREPKHDFGSISMAAGKVTHRYWISNTTAAPIVIRKIYTSCMCTTAALVKGVRKFDPYGMPGHGHIPAINETLHPNEDAFIEVVFDPAAHGPSGVGPIERFVTVETSSERPLELAFSALVRP